MYNICVVNIPTLKPGRAIGGERVFRHQKGTSPNTSLHMCGKGGNPGFDCFVGSTILFFNYSPSHEEAATMVATYDTTRNKSLSVYSGKTPTKGIIHITTPILRFVLS